jgi:hypothetical protein
MTVLPVTVLFEDSTTAAPVNINPILHSGNFLGGRTTRLFASWYSACFASGTFAKTDSHQ